LVKQWLIRKVLCIAFWGLSVQNKIDAAILSHASPRLRLIANFGAGTDHIDVSTAHAKGIPVTNTPGVLTEDTADLAMALILAVPRRLVEGDRRMRAGEYEGWGPTHMLGHRVRGGKLGILGMGRIGQALARRATAATHESRREMGELVLINIRAMMDHHAAPNRVLPPGASFQIAS